MSTTQPAPHVRALIVPFDHLEFMEERGQSAALLALHAAPVTPLESFYESPYTYSTDKTPRHMLVLLLDAPDAAKTPVTVIVDRVRVCTMNTGECASIHLPPWGVSVEFETQGRRMAAPTLGTYVSDGLMVPEAGVSEANIAAMEFSRPFQTSFDHSLVGRAA